MEAYPLRAENIPSFPLLPVSQIHLLNDADLGKCYSELLSLVQANDFSPEELSLQQYTEKLLVSVCSESEKRSAERRVMNMVLDKKLPEFQPFELASTSPPSPERIEAPAITKKPEVKTIKVPQPNNKEERIERKPPSPIKKKTEAPKPSNNKEEQERETPVAVKQPVKHSAPVIMSQKNWGTAFVVQGKKKRRRPVPKRAPAPLTPAEEAQQREKERQARRKAAHERLLARRKEQEMLRAKEKQRRMQNKKSEATDTIQSSESESDSDVDSADEIPDEILKPYHAETPQQVPTEEIDDEPQTDDPSSVTADILPSKLDEDLETDEKSVEITASNSDDAPDEPTVVDTASEFDASKPNDDDPQTDDESTVAAETTVKPDEDSNPVDETSTGTPMKDQPPECDEEVPESDTTQEEEKKELPEWLQVSAPTEEERAELDKKLSELQLVSQQEIRKTGSKKVSRPAYSAGKRDGRRGLQDKLALMRKQAEHLVECNSKIDRTIESISSVPHPPVVQEPDVIVPTEAKEPVVVVKSESIRPVAIQKRRRRPEPKIQRIPTPIPVVDESVVDYSSIYPSFRSIMSAFEGNRKASKSAVIIDSENAALRIQLKLYTIWKSIMCDYKSVFDMPMEEKSSASGSIFNPDSNGYSLLYRVNSSTRPEVYNIITEAFQKMEQWEELPTGLGLKQTWNLLWSWSKPRVDRSTLLCWQKVNHFAGARALTRKDLLKRNLHRYKSMGGKMRTFDILPETFVLPNEYVQFIDSFTKRGVALGPKKNMWIMKPVGLSRGRGISLINDVAQVCYGESMIVQQYIHNPLLIDGYKFDLRIYVLVTSFSPLEAFIYQEGFVRLCTRKYTDSPDSINNLFVHLTNSSIQKHNTDTVTSDNPLHTAPKSEAGGSKTSLAYLWDCMRRMGVDPEDVKRSIDEVVLKTLICADDQIPFQPNSFELFGFDVLLDEDMKAWLIEVNTSPSMSRDSSIDKIKNDLIYDTIKLVDAPNYDRDVLVSVFERRLNESEKSKARPYSRNTTPQEAEQQKQYELNKDLTSILHGEKPRMYGELPRDLGNYRRLGPNTEMFDKFMKVKDHYIKKI